jgi:DNA ligase (NAD+)
VARDLARHFATFAALRGASAERLQEVPGVGPRMAEAITAFFADPGNAAVLDELLKKVSLKEGKPAAAAALKQPLVGKKFVFTGGLAHLTRRRAQELVEGLGGKAVGSVSKATDYVVVGEDAGSKAEAARKLGVETLDEEAFLALLTQHGVDLAELEQSA